MNNNEASAHYPIALHIFIVNILIVECIDELILRKGLSSI